MSIPQTLIAHIFCMAWSLSTNDFEKYYIYWVHWKVCNQKLTWLSNRGCSKEDAEPDARYISLSYEPTGSKLNTHPFPARKCHYTLKKSASVSIVTASSYNTMNIPSASKPARMLYV